jgi:penicillin amidase
MGPDPSGWRAPVESLVFRKRNFLQVPQAYGDELKLPAMNRGTQNHVVVLSAAGVRGMNVLPPGESGRTDTEGQARHAADQLRLFADFEYKPMNFVLSDVMRTAESEEVLTYPQ